jgi:lipopolysaccharide-induced tumor necrosis factor-alpha factor
MVLGPYPVQANCPNCHSFVITRVVREPGTMVYAWCILLCCIAAPFCFIPFCCDQCQDAKHYCPMCSHFLGVKTNC